MKVNLAVGLDIQNFTGSSITDYNSGVTNCIIKRTGERPILTQRPSIDISEDASGLGLNDRARGIYYWEENSKLYIVHDNDVYPANQSAVALGQITAGSERVTILETTGTPYMIILDSENDEGWYVSTAESLTQIASNFPTTLAHGGAVLDGYLFVMDEDGVIYNSAVNDPTTFPATGFLTAERERDKGVSLIKHHDHLVAFGTRTIEFFYDAGNSTGSPLNRRSDISYNVGCADGLSMWENGDIVYFIGSNRPGQLSVYKLENFRLEVVSTDAINSYLTQGLTQDGLKVNGQGLSAMGHDTYLLTVYTLTGASPGMIVPRVTLSYDSVTGQWGFWEIAVNDHTGFPLMAWTKRTGGQNATVAARTGEGILYNGDVINVNDKLIPIDTILGSTGVYEEGVFETDIYTGISTSTGTNIGVTIRTGLVDGDRSSAYKFQRKETVEMENTPSSQTLTIKHSDESTNSFDAGVTIDTSDDRKDAYQGGRFMKRNYQLEYAGDEQIYLEALDLDLSQGL